MLRFIAGLVLGFSLVASAGAQAPNPYGPQRAGAAAAVLPDGSLNWPTFFKSPALESRFQMYFELGSCRGTKQSINSALENNKIHVNQLSEGSFVGRVLAVDSGMVAVIDPTGLPLTLVSHPAGVTKIEVTGKMHPAALQPGMTLRMSAGVDDRSQGLERVDAVDVITPSPDVKPKGVEPGRVQTIIGTISKVEGEKIRLSVVPGKMHRLTFLLSEATTVDVKGNALNLVAAGDEISTKGRVFLGQGTFPAKMIFASEITVKKTFTAPALADANQVSR